MVVSLSVSIKENFWTITESHNVINDRYFPDKSTDKLSHGWEQVELDDGSNVGRIVIVGSAAIDEFHNLSPDQFLVGLVWS